MDGALRLDWYEVAQWWKPAKARTFVILAGSEQQVRRTIMMQILAVSCILNVNWALALSQHCRIGGEEDSRYSQEMADWAGQKGDQGDKTEAESSSGSHFSKRKLAMNLLYVVQI